MRGAGSRCDLLVHAARTTALQLADGADWWQHARIDLEDGSGVFGSIVSGGAVYSVASNLRLGAAGCC